ncbi:MAG: translocation/assembly module TamB domain-containing protein, partial [Rhodospirillaceae bacterium]
ELDPALLALTGPVPQFDILIQQAADGTVTVERARLIGAAAELHLAGTLDPETLETDLELGMHVTKPEAAAQITSGARFSAARATATVRGPPDRLTVGVRSQIGGFSGFGVTTARIEAGLDANLHRHGGTGTISIGISGIAADSPGDMAGLPPKLDLTTSFAIDLEEQTVALSDLRLAGAGMAVTGGGRADLDGGDVALDLRATTDSLAPVAAIAGIDLSGRADASVTLSGGGLGERMSGTLSVELADVASDVLPLAPTLGRSATLTATIAAASPDGIEISAFRLAGTNLALDGKLAIGGAGDTIDLAATLGEHRLAPWEAMTGKALAGSISGTVSVSGPLADPQARLDIDLNAIGTDDGAVGPFDGRIAAGASTLASAPSGLISANLTGPDGPIAAATRFALPSPDTLAFDAIRVTAAGVRLDGTVSLGLESGLATGNLAIAADNLDTVGAIAGIPLRGSLTADISLGSTGDDQTATLRLAAPALTLTQPGGGELAVRGTAGTARLDGLSPEPKFDVEMTVDSLSVGDMAFTELSLTANGTPARIAFDAEGAGTLPAPVDLAASGSVGEADGGWTVTLDRLTGSAADYPFRLRAPVTATVAAGRLSVSPLDLSLGDGRLTGQAALDPQRVAVRLDLAGLPLAMLAALADGAPPLGGTMSLQATLNGDPATPDGSVDLQLADVTASEVAPAESVALHGKATARLGDGQLALQADIGGFAERGLTLDAALPLRLSVQPFAASLPPEGAIEGRMDWQGQVATLWEALPLAGHRLAGVADISLRAGGTVADPLVTARLSLADGRYENLDIGTVLDRLAVSATVDAGRTLTVELSGTDGGSGTLSGAGTVELDPPAGFPMTVDLQFGDATLVRRDDVTLSANGDLDISGDMTAMTLSGEIETTRIEARVDESLPPSVVDLDVVDSQAAEDAQVAGSEEAAEPSPLTLDLALVVPRQAFVRGRGLDSEWAGRLEITGNAASPAIAGTLSFVRGDFNFAGKRFSLEGSTIVFDGTPDADPLLNIRAAHRTGDVTALILIGGRASNPTIELSASPPLPQDEILARVLFGKGAGSLSALEAVQLAAAVGQLSGQAGGVGVLDRMRNALGVDVIEVGAGEEGGANLRAGRYINENTFVGVTQGTTPGSTGVIVEIEVLPNITIDTEVDPRGTNKTGVKWKYDY